MFTKMKGLCNKHLCDDENVHIATITTNEYGH